MMEQSNVVTRGQQLAVWGEGYREDVAAVGVLLVDLELQSSFNVLTDILTISAHDAFVRSGKRI